MIKGLHTRITIVFTLLASLVLIMAAIIIIFEVHNHFLMFQEDFPDFNTSKPLIHHFEQALLGSIVWTSVGAILFVCIISYFVARKLSRPLVEMRNAAEKMAKGELDVRVKNMGSDEIRDLGDKLNQLASKLQKQEISRKNMTSDIAHELRTPLATVKSHLEAFEDGVFQPTKERIHSLREEIDRLIYLVKELEELTVMEAPEFKLNKQKQDLCRILKNSTDSVSGLFAQNGIKLLMNCRTAILINVDEMRMKQVFVNLLSNALKYTEKNGEVLVSAEEKEDSIVVIVKDTGTGIPKEDLEHVFERFYRSERSRNREFGGSGIGLTIVKRIVDEHGGHIWIESELEKGTTVHIVFPK